MLGPAKILVFDSGLGGLTVLAEIIALRPDAACIYAADDAVFPYGRLPEALLLARVNQVMAALIPAHAPDVVVIACNTASTLVLPTLRARYPDVPFVGTVPAIKPAALASRSAMISVLATPGTVARDYTQALVRDFASHCAVTLVGATRLASLAERFMQGFAIAEGEVAAEIVPAFVERDGRRTDTIVLACTHYPLLQGIFQHVQPWPVIWIDPAPAIARRTDQVLRNGGNMSGGPGVALHGAVFSSGRKPSSALKNALRLRRLQALDWAFPASSPQGDA